MSVSMLYRSLPFYISLFLSRFAFDFSCCVARIIRYAWYYITTQSEEESSFYYENLPKYSSQLFLDLRRDITISFINCAAAFVFEAVGVFISAFLFPDLDFDMIDSFQNNFYLIVQFYFC